MPAKNRHVTTTQLLPLCDAVLGAARRARRRAARGAAARARWPRRCRRCAGAARAVARGRRVRCAARRAAPPPRAAAAESSSDARPGAKGRMTYRPQSYNEIVADAVRALQAAIADGERLLEVEFPPLPASKDGAWLRGVGCT
jgi:hypothetical protein